MHAVASRYLTSDQNATLEGVGHWEYCRLIAQMSTSIVRCKCWLQFGKKG